MLPSLPSLPTDNLYKFLALSGVVLLIATAVLAEIDQRERSDTINQLRIDQARALAKVKIMGEQFDAESKLNPRWFLSKEAYDIKREVAVENATIGPRVEAIKERIEDFRADISVYVFFEMAGSGLAIIGFVCWYARVQRYQDRILAKQARNDAFTQKEKQQLSHFE